MYSDLPANLTFSSCTVVICTRNRPVYLCRCIEELQKQQYRSFEILVVDNNHESSDACQIAANYGTRYLLCPTIGLSYARNAGIAASRTEYIAFIDDDAIPEPQWLLKLLAEFSRPEVVAVTGQIVMEGEHSFNPIYSMEPLCVDKGTPHWFEITNFGGIGNGSNMAFRRKDIDVCTGFEECLGRGKLLDAWEDDYAFFTLVHLGKTIAYVPDAVVHHPAPPAHQSSFKSMHTIAISSAYVMLLACRHPRYCRQIIQFMIDAIRRAPRTWRQRSQKPFDGGSPTLLIYAALLSGPFVYFGMLITEMFRSKTPEHVQVQDPEVSSIRK